MTTMSNEESIGADHRDAILSYIDKVYSSMSRAWDLEKRIFNLQVLLSIATISLATHLVTAKDEIELGDITFKIDSQLLMVLGALLVSYLFLVYFSVTEQLNIYRQEIERLYGVLGYSDRLMHDPLTSPFESPDVLHSFRYAFTSLKKTETGSSFMRRYDVVRAVFILLGFWVLLPLGAQLTTTWQLAKCHSWVWAPALLVIFLTWASFLVKVKRQFFPEQRRD
jgi:hypothetical protein